MGDGFLAVDITLHHTILIDTNGGQNVERVLVTGVDSVEDQANDDLLPCGATLVPELGLFEVDNVADVLHDTVQSPRRQHLIFVIVRNRDQKLRMTVVHGRTEVVAIVQGELVGVAGRSGV